jgi:hypothetical protein
MARAKQPPAAPEPDDEFVPPFYEATEDLFIYNPEAGVMPGAAFRKGDRVPPGGLLPEWGGKLKVPAAFEDRLPPPQPPAPQAPPAAGPDQQPQADANADESAGKE